MVRGGVHGIRSTFRLLAHLLVGGDLGHGAVVVARLVLTARVAPGENCLVVAVRNVDVIKVVKVL